jgi:hypothetical protein
MPFLEAAMWTPDDRALVRDFGSGRALSDDQYRLLEPFIPPPKRGRPALRTTDMRLSCWTTCCHTCWSLVAPPAIASGISALAYRVGCLQLMVIARRS